MIRVLLQQPSLAKYRIPVFRELAARPGIDLHVIYGTRRDLPNAPPDGFRATPYPLRYFRLGRAVACYHAPQWTKAARKHCDVLMLTWNARYWSLLPGLVRARANGVGTVLWGHGYSKRGDGLNFKFRASLSDWATALLFYNHDTREKYVAQGFEPSRLFVALNTLDRTEIVTAREAWSDPAALKSWSDQHDLRDRSVILYVSRLDPNNRVDRLIDALPHVVQRVPNALAAIIGGGTPEYLSQLRARAERLGVSRHLRLLGAIYNERELAPWFLTARVFCYPANIGLSLIHALLYGLPVITSRHRARQNPEIEAFHPEVNGLDYADDSLEELTTQLSRCLEDDALRTRLAAGAAASVAQRFTLPQMVDGMEAAIRYAHQQCGRKKVRANP